MIVMKQERKNNVWEVKCQNVVRTSSLSAPSSHQGNPITAYCSLYQPLSTPVIFGHIFFHPRPCSRWRPGQSDWGSEWRVWRVRGCLLQRWASVIRTAQGWKDNRQNNVLFKDGSPPLFLKVVRRPKEAGLNTGGNKGVVPCRAQAFVFRNVLQSNFQNIQILNAHCVRFNKKTHYKKHHIFIPLDTLDTW